jgi:hypothetical protein
MIYNIILLIILIVIIIILYNYKAKYNEIPIDSETIKNSISKNTNSEITLYEDLVKQSNQDINIINNELNSINNTISNLKNKKSEYLTSLNITQDEIDNNLAMQSNIFDKLMIKLQNIIDTKNNYITKINKLINERELLYSNIYDKYNKYLNMNNNIVSEINTENQIYNNSINNNKVTMENNELQLIAAKSLMAETEQGCNIIQEKNLEIKNNEVTLTVNNMNDKTSNQDKLLYPFYQNANNNNYSYLSNLNTYVTNEYTTLPNSKKQLIDLMEDYKKNPTFNTLNINNNLLSTADIEIYLNNFNKGNYTLPESAKGTIVDNIDNINKIIINSKKAYDAYINAQSQTKENSKIVVQQIVTFLNDKSAYFKLLRSQEIALKNAELLKQEQILDEKIDKNTIILSENESMLLQLTKEMDPLQKQEASLNEDIVNYNKQLDSYKEIYIKSDKTPDAEQTYTDIVANINNYVSDTQAKLNNINKQLNILNGKYVGLKSTYNKVNAANKVLIEQDNPTYILQNLVNKSVATDYGASLIYNSAALNDLRIIEKTIYPLLFQQWITTPGIFYVNKIFNSILDGNNDVNLFHKKCDMMGGTIALITEKYTGNRIGGYTSLSYGLAQGQLYDPDSFIFDIAKGIIYNTQIKHISNTEKKYHKQSAIENDKFESVYMDPALGPIFGSGYIPDLGIWYNTDERINGNDKNNYMLNITSSIYLDETTKEGLFIYNDNNNVNKKLGIYNLEVFQVFYIKLLPFYINKSFASANGIISNFDYDKYINGNYNGWLLPFTSLNLLYRNSTDGSNFSKSVCLRGPTIYYITLKPLVGSNIITIGIYVNVSLNTLDKYTDPDFFIFQINIDSQNNAQWNKADSTSTLQINSDILTTTNMQIDFKNKKVSINNSPLPLSSGNYDFIDCEIYQVMYTNQSIVKQMIKSKLNPTINLLTKLSTSDSNIVTKFEKTSSLMGSTCIIMTDENKNRFGCYTNYGYNSTELYNKTLNDPDTNIIGARIFESINMFHRNTTNTTKNITFFKGQIVFGSDFICDLSTGILTLGSNSDYNTIDNLNNSRLFSVMNGNNINNTKIKQPIKLIDIEVYQIMYNNVDVMKRYLPLLYEYSTTSLNDYEMKGDTNNYCRAVNNTVPAGSAQKQIIENNKNISYTLESCAKRCNENQPYCTGFDFMDDGTCFHWNLPSKDSYEPQVGSVKNKGCWINKNLNLNSSNFKLIYDLNKITKDPTGSIFHTNCSNMGATILICSYIDSNNTYRQLALYSTKGWTKTKYSDTNSFIYDMNKNIMYNMNVNLNQTIYVDNNNNLVFGDITIVFSDNIQLQSSNPLLYLDTKITLTNLTVYQIYQTNLYNILSSNNQNNILSLNLLLNNNKAFHTYCDMNGGTLSIISLVNSDSLIIYTTIPWGLYNSYTATDNYAFACYVTKHGEYRQLYNSNSNMNINISSKYAVSIGNIFVDLDNKQIIYDKPIYDIMYPGAINSTVTNVSTDIESISVYNANYKLTDIFNRLKWIPDLKSLNLLYRGSVDGMDIDNSINPERLLQNKFHYNCDNAGPTLTIVRDTLGNVYGGYTSQSWTSDADTHIYDNNAFICEINDNPKKYTVNTIYVNKTQTGPCFGDYNNGKTNKLNIMQSKRNTINTPSLTGDKTFIVAEIEVYQVSFHNTISPEIKSPLALKLKTM